MKLLVLGLLFLECSLSFAANEVKPKSTPVAVGAQIDSINVKIYDRQKNAFVEDGKQSDPYGMQNDLFITVQLSKIGDKDVTVKASVTTPKTFDEARGETKATSQSKTLTVTQPDSAVSAHVTIPFLFLYECNPMTVLVELVGLKAKKEIKVPAHCAE